MLCRRGLGGRPPPSGVRVPWGGYAVRTLYGGHMGSGGELFALAAKPQFLQEGAGET